MMLLTFFSRNVVMTYERAPVLVELKISRRTVAVQSPTRYVKGRFTPLADRDHGAWSD